MSKITQKGQVTIGRKLRDRFHLVPGKTQVEIVERNGQLVIVKAEESPFRRRRGVDKGTMTTDEVMELTRG